MGMSVCFENHPTLGTEPQKHSYRWNVFGHVPGWRTTGKDVEAPIQHVRDIDRLIGSHGQEVSPCHLARLMCGFTEGTDDLAVLVQFDDPVVSSIRHPNMLIAGNHQTIRVADSSPLLNEVSIRIEDLYPLIFTVANVYASLFVDGNALR